MTVEPTSRGAPNALRAAYPPGRSALATVLGAPFEPRTYLRALHLLLMFPLGVAYFVVFVTLFAVGFSLIWTFVGPAVLLVALYATRWLGDVEAWMTRRVGGIELRRPPTAIERGLSFRTQVKTQLVDPTTWTGLAYLVLQFPLGIAAFVGLVTLTAFGGAFAVAPVWAWVTGEPLRVLDATEVSGIVGPLLVLGGLAILLLESHLVKLASAGHVAWARFALGSRAPHIAPRPGGLEGGPGRGLSPAPQELDALPAHEAPRLEGGPAGAGGLGLVEATTSLDRRLADLTPRELDVLRLIGRGYSNAEIAETFVISEGTVKTHVKRVFAKLEVNDRARAAVLAFDTRLVRPQAAPAEATEPAPVVPMRRLGPR